MTRRRPGHGKICPVSANYNLHWDRLIRANGKFNDVSLGRAVILYAPEYSGVPSLTRSYIHKDEHETVVNHEMSFEEAGLILQMEDYRTRETPLKIYSPRIYRKVADIALSGARARLVRARRARHTHMAVSYARSRRWFPTSEDDLLFPY